MTLGGERSSIRTVSELDAFRSGLAAGAQRNIASALFGGLLDMCRLARALVIAGGIAVATQARAHHGIANFDLNKDIELSGVVTDLAFVNPHSWLYLERDRRRRRAYAVALRDARRDRAKPLRLVRRYVREWLDAFGSPAPRIGASRTRVISARSRSRTAAAWTATVSGRKPRQAAAGGAPGRLANGRPNLDGDWAAEQRVMTDRAASAARSCRSALPTSSRPARCRRAGARFRARAARRSRWRRRDSYGVDPAEPCRAHGGRQEGRRRIRRHRPPTTRACAASRRTSCSTGRSTRS